MQTLVSLTDTSSSTKWSMLLLLRMLEAANVDLVFTISLKRSTQNLQLSTNRRPITPSHGGQSGHAAEIVRRAESDPNDPNRSSRSTASMRLSGRPRHESLGLESSNNGGAGTYSLATSKYGAIRRQIEVHPACPVRHDEQMHVCQ